MCHNEHLKEIRCFPLNFFINNFLLIFFAKTNKTSQLELIILKSDLLWTVLLIILQELNILLIIMIICIIIIKVLNCFDFLKNETAHKHDIALSLRPKKKKYLVVYILMSEMIIICSTSFVFS